MLTAPPRRAAAGRDNRRVSTTLIVPFAAPLSEAGRQALQTLALPRLQRLLARWTPAAPLGSDEFSPNPPHEQALARALGWGSDAAALAHAALPFAAAQAAALGLAGAAEADDGWAWLTPVHLHVGTEQVSLTDPAALRLDEAASCELLDILRPLFETEGFALHWAEPGRWLARHALFAGLATASLDRVTGRNVDPWLPDQRGARLLRRLQNEVQMLLYTHAVNERREAAGLPTVNSLWFSGAGRLAAGSVAQRDDVRVDARLRAPALGEDWAAWCAAWQALDAGPVAALAAQPGATLVLCGERRALALSPQPRSLWQRLGAGWRSPAPHQLLETL